MNSKSKKVAILAAFVLFGFTLNSCKKCNKEGKSEDGNGKTSNSTSATDPADLAGTTDLDGLPTLVVASDGTIDPKQWDEYIEYVNINIDALRNHKAEALKQKDIVRNLDIPNDFDSASEICIPLVHKQWNENALGALKESESAYTIIKNLLFMWNGWQTEAANDTSLTADLTKDGIKRLKEVMQTALDEATLVGQEALEAWKTLVAIHNKRVPQRDWGTTITDAHQMFILIEGAYTIMLYLASFANIDDDYLAQIKTDLRQTTVKRLSFNAGATAKYAQWGSGFLTKWTEAIKDDVFSQLLVASGLKRPSPISNEVI